MRRLFCGFLIAVLTPCLGGCGAAPTVAPITRAARPPAKAPVAYQPILASRRAPVNQPGTLPPNNQVNNQANGYGAAPGSTARPGQPQTTAQPAPRPVTQPRR